MRSTPTTRAVTFIQYQDNILPFTHLDIGGPVATLSLDHAGGNPINFDMRVELREAVQQIEKSPARALLVRGEGGQFCLCGECQGLAGPPPPLPPRRATGFSR